MTIYCVTSDRHTPTAMTDAQLYDQLYNHRSGVIADIESGMAVTVSGQTVTVNRGVAILQGRFVHISEPETITIPSDAVSGSHVVIQINLTVQNESTGTPGTADYFPIDRQTSVQVVNSLVQDNLNNEGSLFMLPLGTITGGGAGWVFTRDSRASFDNQPLGIEDGGTNIKVNPSLKVNLASEDADAVFKSAPRPGIYGVLGEANGGFGRSIASLVNGFFCRLQDGVSFITRATAGLLGFTNEGIPTTYAFPLGIDKGGLGATELTGTSGAIRKLFPTSGISRASTSTGTLYFTGFAGNWEVPGYISDTSLRNALGLGNTLGALPVANGGTNATTAAQARTNLGAASTAVATASAAGLMSSTDKSKLDKFSNAFSEVRVPSGGYVLADTPTDILTLANGAGISITGNADNDSITIASTDARFTTTEKNKLSGIKDGAEVNQNAFSNVNVSSGSNIVAGSKSSTLTLAAGAGISVTGASSGQVTIASNQNAFTHIKVPNGTVSADTTSDTLTLTTAVNSANGGITIAGNATNDEINFRLTGESYTSTEKNKLAGIEKGAQANPTMAELLSGQYSITSSGQSYVRFGVFMICWGLVTVATVAADSVTDVARVTFPKAFSAAPGGFSLVVNGGSGQVTANIKDSSRATTGFVPQLTNHSSTAKTSVTLHWVAFGSI